MHINWDIDDDEKLSTGSEYSVRYPGGELEGYPAP